ncbi:uncharacterized protein LY89DRAFT_738927 [Mollisia scopiformis]|uniref:Uncharacterized protein n=1 Tax=Mollisia scopiformis TaxID=149040 RepID=A0A194WV79_MOLSC|nr:uncharacterized protein LY89DRAFT_738927 [Mollisia scopiformis]KUJ11492.1 hypothetical protein LY89DRAFT_738927 [Mollisia scopiformis]
MELSRDFHGVSSSVLALISEEPEYRFNFGKYSGKPLSVAPPSYITFLIEKKIPARRPELRVALERRSTIATPTSATIATTSPLVAEERKTRPRSASREDDMPPPKIQKTLQESRNSNQSRVWAETPSSSYNRITSSPASSLSLSKSRPTTHIQQNNPNWSTFMECKFSEQTKPIPSTPANIPCLPKVPPKTLGNLSRESTPILTNTSNGSNLSPQAVLPGPVKWDPKTAHHKVFRDHYGEVFEWIHGRDARTLFGFTPNHINQLTPYDKTDKEKFWLYEVRDLFAFSTSEKSANAAMKAFMAKNKRSTKDIWAGLGLGAGACNEEGMNGPPVYDDYGNAITDRDSWGNPKVPAATKAMKKDIRQAAKVEKEKVKNAEKAKKKTEREALKKGGKNSTKRLKKEA